MRRSEVFASGEFEAVGVVGDFPAIFLESSDHSVVVEVTGGHGLEVASEGALEEGVEKVFFYAHLFDLPL